MDEEVDALEQKLASLLAHVRALRAANEDLRRELASSIEQNAVLLGRMQAAGNRLDAVLHRMPAE